MFHPSRPIAALLFGASLFLTPLVALASEQSGGNGNDSIDNQLAACLQTGLALNDSAYVRDCDRFNRGSAIFGQPASGSRGLSIY